MIAKGLTPILNVSSFQQSVAWFHKIGWKPSFAWGHPPRFGGVTSGDYEIFLCEGGQGGRGASPIKSTFGPEGDETADKGVWMSLWVDDVDEVYRQCMEQGLDVAYPPTDMEWNVREMHLRHPDGHVFRISRSLE
jgi:catechol 2,3-dioxygenase-like lactoylglutathione lyase family enzyme